MRLTTMADAFRNQLDDRKFKEVPFEDRLGMLVDIEYSNRKNNRQKRLIRNAGFDQPEANIMDINYTSGRKLNKDLINRLATCEYISEHRNLFITGATGCGKTYMACAFGISHRLYCKQQHAAQLYKMQLRKQLNRNNDCDDVQQCNQRLPQLNNIHFLICLQQKLICNRKKVLYKQSE